MLLLGKERNSGGGNLDLKMESVVLLLLVPSYPLTTNIFLVSFLIEKGKLVDRNN